MAGRISTFIFLEDKKHSNDRPNIKVYILGRQKAFQLLAEYKRLYFGKKKSIPMNSRISTFIFWEDKKHSNGWPNINVYILGRQKAFQWLAEYQRLYFGKTANAIRGFRAALKCRRALR